MGDDRFTQSWGRNLDYDKPIVSVYTWVAKEVRKLIKDGKVPEAFDLRNAAIKAGKFYLHPNPSRISRDVYLEEVKPDTEEYAYIERTMEQSFPEKERPDRVFLRHRMDNPLFHCFVIMDYPDKTPVGLITYWTFSDFVYIEHFAVDPSARGHGLGTSILYKLIWANHDYPYTREWKGPIVLEVEHPTTENARRYIAFYERQGFKLLGDKGYIQPAFRPGGVQVPMLLMSTTILSHAQYEHVRDTLYRKVYGVEKG